MTSSTNVTKAMVNQFMERLAKQDAEGLGELFADEIDWNVPGSEELPWTGRRSRREHVPVYFRTMWKAFVAGQSTAIPGAVVVDGDDAVILGTFSHTVVSTGKRFETPVALHLTISDGKIVRMHLYEDTHAVNQAFQA
ncbi:nuclear transport factor 2 family protein [Micromonospora sp. NPDC051227]|uniref:nuclear transport factor 2 family protein n=1 Tax=Micromonospora sp. NPDC051227 TaxID=3364285 RepID=UPI001931E98E|nr:nuclear transport factor 2 family protein [Micromonospora sp. STR1s_5]